MPQILVNSSASGASPVTQWGGGLGLLEVSASSFGGATVTLQALNLDGTFTDVAGTALTANGRVAFALPPCRVRVNATAAPTGLNVSAWRDRKGRLGAFLASSGGGSSPIDNVEMSLLGDSKTNYTNATFGIAPGTATITRDTNGLVTVAQTGIGSSILGACTMYLVNVTPTSLMIPGEGAYFDANTITIQTNVTGTPLASTDVTISASLGCVTVMAGFTGRGIFYHLQSYFKGSIKLKGNFGQQGDTSEQMALDAVTKAANAVAPGHFVIDEEGVNNIAPRGSDTPSQAAAVRIANLNTIVGLGRKVIVLAVEPVGYGLSAYQSVNTNIQAMNAIVQAACDGVNKIWVDTFTPMWDSTGSTNIASPGTPCAYTYTINNSDWLHPLYSGSYLNAQPVIAALTPLIVAHDLLPAVYNDTSPVTWATYLRNVGPFTAAPGWATSTTGFGTNASGTRPNAPYSWNAASTGGSPTVVMSILDAKTVRAVHTPVAAANATAVYFEPSGVTLTALGLSPGDKFRVGFKLAWQNYQTSNCDLMQVTVTSGVFANGTGLMFSSQLAPGLQFESDSGSKYVWSGVMTVPSTAIGTTSFAAVFKTHFSAASATGLITDFSGMVWEKVTGTV